MKPSNTVKLEDLRDDFIQCTAASIVSVEEKSELRRNPKDEGIGFL
jgi:hypothetical protein